MAKKQNGMYKLSLFMIPIGIAINFLGNTICTLLNLPVYLDSVGTVLTGALCGLWPGIITGLLSNVVNMITAPWSIYYAPLSMAIGAIAAVASARGWLKSIWKSLILGAVVFAFIGGGLGTIISWTVFGFDVPTVGTNAVVAVAITNITGLNKFVAYLIACWFKDILDKVVCTYICFGLLKAIPVRFLAKLPQGDVYIKDELKEYEE